MTTASNEPRVDFRATGAWLSAVPTDADGTAKVEIQLPDSTTGWRLQARAVTAEISEFSQARHAAAGIRIHLGVQVTAIEADTLPGGVPKFGPFRRVNAPVPAPLAR